MFESILPIVSAADPLSSAVTLGSSGVKLLYNILLIFVVVVVAVALFFGTRFGMSAYKKRKNYKITAVIFNPDGTFYTKRMGKFRTKDNIDKMLFQGSTETMPVINPAHIRSQRVTLFRYGPGQYAVIPPKIWEQTDVKKWGIELINMQMKNFAYLEQRAAVSRWAYIKDTLTRLAPYMTMLILAVLTGVSIWFMLKTGYNIFADATQARIADCNSLLGSGVPTAG